MHQRGTKGRPLLGKRRAKEKKQRQENLQAKIDRAQIALECQPNIPHLQLELADAKEMLQALVKGLASWVDQVL